MDSPKSVAFLVDCKTVLIGLTQSQTKSNIWRDSGGDDPSAVDIGLHWSAGHSDRADWASLYTLGPAEEVNVWMCIYQRDL